MIRLRPSVAGLHGSSTESRSAAESFDMGRQLTYMSALALLAGCVAGCEHARRWTEFRRVGSRRRNEHAVIERCYVEANPPYLWWNPDVGKHARRKGVRPVE